MHIVAVAGVGLTALIVIILLRQYRPEYAVAASVITGVLILTLVLQDLSGLILSLDSMLRAAEISYAPILFKAIGICFVVQIASDTCRDSGESALASKIEIAGKVTILSLALPLYQQVLEIASGLIGR